MKVRGLCAYRRRLRPPNVPGELSYNSYRAGSGRACMGDRLQPEEKQTSELNHRTGRGDERITGGRSKKRKGHTMDECG